MPTSLWRALILLFATFSLFVVAADSVTWQFDSDEGFTSGQVAADGWETVRDVTGNPADVGGLRPGDRIQPVGGSFSDRERFSEWPVGTVLHWNVRRGTQTFATTTRVELAAPAELAFIITVQCFRFAMILMAIVVALRRPDAAEARALANFMVMIGAAGYVAPPWLPDRFLLAAQALKIALIIIGLGYATKFACLFPATSGTGVRAVIRRIALPFAGVAAVFALGTTLAKYGIRAESAPYQSLATAVTQNAMYLMMALMVVAFLIGAIAARGPDRQRALWASGSVLVGFSGIIVNLVALAFDAQAGWLQFAQITIIAIPLGLGYTILRHRTIDIGFVVSRALVLTVVSFIVVAAFGLMERALGKLFIDESHIASRTVEIALALGLGFSLRTLHLRVERAVDFLFFRGRQQSLAALRAFQRDVFYIEDASAVEEQTVALVLRHAGAAAVTIAGEGAATNDDPLFVRLRSSRQPVKLRDTGTALHGEYAFPMVVRGTLTGALIVAAKRNGETYDPVERDLLAEIAERAGIALDALRTVAIRRELEELRAATGGAVPAF
jgi:GAF domain-containing protein